jgi:hypothetical protein
MCVRVCSIGRKVVECVRDVYNGRVRGVDESRSVRAV